MTDKELIRKVWPLVPHVDPALAYAAVLGARAAGVEVTEEPALPERLDIGTTSRCATALFDAAHGAAKPPLAQLYGDGDDVAPLAAELVRRYNAKSAVLAVAEEMERSGLLPSAAVLRLRAVYGDPTP